MVVIDEGLDQGLQHRALIRPDGIIEAIRVDVHLVTACVKICTVRRQPGQQIFPKSMQEVVDGGRIEFQRTTWGFSSIRAPIRLDVVGSNQIRVGKSDDGGVAGHVDFDVDLDAPIHSILLNLRELLRTIGEPLPV